METTGLRPTNKMIEIKQTCSCCGDASTTKYTNWHTVRDEHVPMVAAQTNFNGECGDVQEMCLNCAGAFERLVLDCSLGTNCLHEMIMNEASMYNAEVPSQEEACQA